jgi:hypothetical protein
MYKVALRKFIQKIQIICFITSSNELTFEDNRRQPLLFNNYKSFILLKINRLQ